MFDGKNGKMPSFDALAAEVPRSTRLLALEIELDQLKRRHAELQAEGVALAATRNDKTSEAQHRAAWARIHEAVAVIDQRRREIWAEIGPLRAKHGEHVDAKLMPELRIAVRHALEALIVFRDATANFNEAAVASNRHHGKISMVGLPDLGGIENTLRKLGDS